MRSKYEIFKIGIKDVAPHLLSVFPFHPGLRPYIVTVVPFFTWSTVTSMPNCFKEDSIFLLVK